MSLKPYAEYKDSGQQWLGEVPSHWEVRPSKSVFGLRNERESEDDVHLTPSQALGVLPQEDYMKRTGNKVVLALAGTTMKHVEVDDFVIHLRSFQGGIEWSGFRGKVSPAYTVLSPTLEVVPAFFRHCLKSQGYIETIASLTDQLRDGQSMRYYDFGKTPLPLPSPVEQRAIAEFLDRETAEIDAFIADQEKLIALLAERRTATITRAVTKGLNPDVHMKDSGVQWIGRVPRQWSLGSVKKFGQVMLGKMIQSTQKSESDQLAPYLRAATVQPYGLKLHDVKHMWVSPEEAAGLTLRKNDVVVVEGGGGYGRSAVLTENMDGWAFQNSINRIRPYSKNEGRYVDYVIKAFVWSGYLEVITNKATIPHLTAEKLGAISMAIPSLTEQREIADYLDRETSEIDAAIADAHEAIAFSKERRAAMISAAVTGKIDVRGLVDPTTIEEGLSVGVA